MTFDRAEFRHHPEPLAATKSLWGIQANVIKLYYHGISLGLDGDSLTCPSCAYHTFRLSPEDMKRHIIEKHVQLVIFPIDKARGCSAGYYSPFSTIYDE
jgi:hypothetical protein